MSAAAAIGPASELGKAILDKTELKCDANKLTEQLGTAIKSCTDNKTALILNNCGSLVTFWCYNDSDLVEMVCSSKPSAADGYVAMARRSGYFGKGIKVVDSANSEVYHYIEAGSCYIYEGPGKMKLIDSIERLILLQN